MLRRSYLGSTPAGRGGLIHWQDDSVRVSIDESLFTLSHGPTVLAGKMIAVSAGMIDVIRHGVLDRHSCQPQSAARYPAGVGDRPGLGQRGRHRPCRSLNKGGRALSICARHTISQRWSSVVGFMDATEFAHDQPWWNQPSGIVDARDTNNPSNERAQAHGLFGLGKRDDLSSVRRHRADASGC